MGDIVKIYIIMVSLVFWRQRVAFVMLNVKRNVKTGSNKLMVIWLSLAKKSVAYIGVCDVGFNIRICRLDMRLWQLSLRAKEQRKRQGFTLPLFGEIGSYGAIAS